MSKITKEILDEFLEKANQTNIDVYVNEFNNLENEKKIYALKIEQIVEKQKKIVERYAEEKTTVLTLDCEVK